MTDFTEEECDYLFKLVIVGIIFSLIIILFRRFWRR